MKKGKIIVVDDEDNIRGTLQEILSDEGYEVTCAKDGETALRVFQKEAPDVVLLDVWIPGIDGMQTLKMLKNIDPETEIIMMSGHGSIDTAVKATKLGAYDFIEKPFSLESILRIVAKALRSRHIRLSKKQSGGQSAENMERRFLGSSQSAKNTRKLIRQAAGNDNPTLIVGEPGLGKKFAARVIHNLSARRGKPFVELSCATLTEAILASTLLGNESADQDIDISDLGLSSGGVIFFDRIDKLSSRMQEKLFQILKNRRFRIPGEDSNKTFNIRAIASVTSDRSGVEIGDLNEDLQKFLGQNLIKLTPLRERRDDLPKFIEQFVDDLCDEHEKDIGSVNKEALKTLMQAPWPGNVRQLKQVVEYAVLACDGPTLLKNHLPLSELDIAYEKSAANAFDDIYFTRLKDLPLSPGHSGKQTEKRKGKGLPQKTLKDSVVLCGQGLHSGIKTGMILSPLPPNSGIVFGEISTGDRVPALLKNVRSTEYATTLSNGRVTIKTIEHIMSALHSYGVTNLLIKIGDEAPIMDGSALDFCQIIENSGVKEQDDFIEEVIIDKKISVGDTENGPSLTVEPSDRFSIHYFLDYPSPIGKQEYKYVYESGEKYKETIAPARTFGFLRDIKKLEEAGLASGGKLSNVVLIDDERVVNTPLRFSNEMARHKILDLIGDLHLLGKPIRGHFTAMKSGHTQNIELTQKILDYVTESESKVAEKHAVS